jgi:hypothetical protein
MQQIITSETRILIFLEFMMQKLGVMHYFKFNFYEFFSVI